MKKKSVAILGSTGSIGTQALSIMSEFSAEFDVKLISANSNDKLLLEQSLSFKPNHVVINTEPGYSFLKKKLSIPGTKIHFGNNILSELVESEDFDVVLVAIVTVIVRIRAMLMALVIVIAVAVVIVAIVDILTR